MIRNNRNLTALVGGLILATFYILQIVFNWPGLRLSGVLGQKKFIDEQLVLTFAECFHTKGFEVYEGSLSEEFCSGFQYSIELLRFINILNVKSIGNSKIGYIFIIATVLSLIAYLFLIKISSKTSYLIALMAFCSPGIWLLMERGNYDVLILSLMTLSMVGLYFGFNHSSIFLIAVATLFKFYTLPLMFFLIIRVKNKRNKISLILASIPFTLYLGFLIIQVSSFPESWNVSFGLKSFGLYVDFVLSKYDLRLPFPEVTSIVPGIALTIICLLLFTKMKLHIGLLESTAFIRTRNVYNGVLIVLLSCYFAGMSFDYRLVYLAILVAISRNVFGNNRYLTLQIISGLFALYLSCFSFGINGIGLIVLQLLGDFSLAIFISLQLLYIWQIYLRPKYVVIYKTRQP